jgi:cell wall-associated NlpC family hydrolase
LRHTRTRARTIAGLASAAALAGSLVFAATAGAESGGTAVPGTDVPTGKAKLTKDGTAIAPSDAPPRVQLVIEAANEIEDKPYRYGGGHAKWRDKGYDCSGAVSYALHRGRFLKDPMPSGGFESWEKRGKGEWITVYANGGHVYAVIAGLRWDTSMTPGDGPGWSEQMRSKRGFEVRHPKGF